MNEPAEPSHEINSSVAIPVAPVGQVAEQTPVVESPPVPFAVVPVSEAATMLTPDTAVADETAASMAPMVDDGAPRVGRYTHAELAAMQGKRGRKPPEFYQLFPKAAGSDVTTKSRPAKPAGEVARRPRVAAVRISSALIGDHSIDELLDMVGLTGKKPVAYDILRQAAQVFADRGALDLPKATHDPLAQQVATAPARIRELISDLVRLGTR